MITLRGPADGRFVFITPGSVTGVFLCTQDGMIRDGRISDILQHENR